MTAAPLPIRSRDNASLVQVRRALRDPGAYRRDGAPIWLEGDHLLRACLARGWPLQQVLVADRPGRSRPCAAWPNRRSVCCCCPMRCSRS
jgi:hypothetical protein